MISSTQPVYDLLIAYDVPAGSLADMWRTYLDDNTSADLSGMQIDDAEKTFLLEQLGDEDNNPRSVTDLWRDYLTDQGYTNPSVVLAFLEWIGNGGALVPTGEFILVSGSWDNAGNWDDEAEWNDGA